MDGTALPIPTMQTEQLRGFEKLSVPLLEYTNTHSATKAWIQSTICSISSNWVAAASRNLWELHNLEPLLDLRPPRGVILVANHRSFFDMFVTTAMLYQHVSFIERLFFPVRSNFFYTRPIGMAVNFAIAGGSMWPPIFRDERKDELNRIGMAQMRRVLEQPGSLLGIHPEGTRGRGPDPYQFLSAKAGVGSLIQTAHPDTTVIPFFILGLSNSVQKQLQRNFLPPEQRGEPVRIWFDRPHTAGEFQHEHNPLVISQQLMQKIGVLAEQDREIHGHYYQQRLG